MLSDDQIRQAIRWHGLGIEPFTEDRLQPASMDVTLAPELWVLRNGDAPIDPRVDSSGEWYRQTIGEDGWELQHSFFALGSTVERFCLDGGLVGQLEGKSSLGRLGLVVHSTAGYIDPGFEGQITLELSCAHDRGVVLYPNMPIGQVAFQRTGPVTKAYAGKYVGQSGPTLSRYHENWTGDGWK